jgi:DNA-binding transcriptional ArsR family regulator
MEDLRTLAETYVALTGQIEEVRRAMLACLTNGADPNPMHPARLSSGSQSNHPNAAKAAEAEEKIIALLRERPMKAVEITAATESRQSTTSERLRRLRQRGLVTLGGGGAWAATA